MYSCQRHRDTISMYIHIFRYEFSLFLIICRCNAFSMLANVVNFPTMLSAPYEIEGYAPIKKYVCDDFHCFYRFQFSNISFRFKLIELTKIWKVLGKTLIFNVIQFLSICITHLVHCVNKKKSCRRILRYRCVTSMNY